MDIERIKFDSPSNIYKPLIILANSILFIVYVIYFLLNDKNQLIWLRL